MDRRAIALVLLTFACGAVYELACVFWVHYSEKGRARAAVGFSMLAALVTVVGVEQFLKSHAFAVAYIAGFGTGTYLAIRIKTWLRSRPISTAEFRKNEARARAFWHGERKVDGED